MIKKLITNLKLKAHVWLVTKTKALDPHLRDPQVGPGEAADCASLPPEVRTIIKNKCSGVPRLGRLSPKNRLQTLAKVFLVNLPASVEKRPFSATDGILTREPEFSALPHRHQRMQRGGANQVCAIWQVISAGAQRVVDSKGPTVRPARLRHSFIKLINH